MNEQTNQETASTPDAKQVETTLHNHIYTAMGIGLVPIPVLDFVGLSAVQLDLIRSLSKQYHVPFQATKAKEIICALIGGTAGIAGGTMLASIMKIVPVIGYPTGALSTTIIGGAVTYATGRLIIRHYEKGGSLDDFNTAEAKEAFDEVVAEGKEVAQKVATETKKKAQSVKKAATRHRSTKTNSTAPVTDAVYTTIDDDTSDTENKTAEK